MNPFPYVSLISLVLNSHKIWVVSVTPRPLYPPRKTQYPLYRRLGGPQGRSGRVRKISPLTRIRFPDCPASSESQYRLSYIGPQILMELHEIFWQLSGNNCNTRYYIIDKSAIAVTWSVNPLTSNDNYTGRTAPLTSKVAFYIFIQQIQVLNILNMAYTLRVFPFKMQFFFHNSKVFGSCIIHILYTGVLKLKE